MNAKIKDQGKIRNFVKKKLVSTKHNELMIGSCFMVLGESKHWILMIHFMMDTDERQDQIYTFVAIMDATCIY